MHQRHYDPETLDYDQHGNVLGITDGATGRFQRGNRDMAYDGLDRLTSTVSPMFGTASDVAVRGKRHCIYSIVAIAFGTTSVARAASKVGSSG